jgi:hypothetical protein
VTHADDMPFEQVMAIVRTSLRADHGRHLRWLNRGHTAVRRVRRVLLRSRAEHASPTSSRSDWSGTGCRCAAPRTGATSTAWTRPPVASDDGAPRAVARPAHERARAIEPIARELDLHRLTVSSIACAGAKA